MESEAPQTVEELIAALGRPRVQRRCGVTKSAVSNWIAWGSLPTGRYFQFRDMCRENGIPVPEHLFAGMALEPGE